MLGSQHTILVLSDEAALVYASFGGRYRFIADVDWQDPDFVHNLADILENKCRKRPVKILYDMVEQYYRREVVPKVAIFDQRLVLERRLVAAFPNYVMRQALPLKSDLAQIKAQGEKDKATLGGKPYLFSAIPDHDSLTQIIDAVREAMVYVVGLYLLPVESVSMVQKLSAALNGDKVDPDRWIVFMSQHRGGGLRQIVVRNGELCLTRMTNVIETNVEHEVWATQVAQEFTATMGYVSRFGYTADSSLEVIVVGHTDAVDLLQPILKATQFHGITVDEASRTLRLPVFMADQGGQGEVLHVGWAAKQIRYVMPVVNRPMAFISRVRRSAKVASIALIFAALGAVGYMGNEGINLFNKSQDIVHQKESLKKVEKEYNDLVAEIEASNINVKLVQGSVAIQDGLEANKLDLIQFMRTLGRALSADFQLDQLSISYEASTQQTNNPLSVETIQTQRIISKLNISFSGDMKPELANQRLNDFRARLVRAFPGYDAVVTQPVTDLTYSTSTVVKPGAKGGIERDTRARQNAVLTLTQKTPTGGAS